MTNREPGRDYSIHCPHWRIEPSCCFCDAPSGNPHCEKGYRATEMPSVMVAWPVRCVPSIVDELTKEAEDLDLYNGGPDDSS